MIILKVLSQMAMRLPDTIVALLWSNTGCGYRCIQLGQNCLDATIMGDVVSTGLNHGCGHVIWCMSTFSFVSIDTKFSHRNFTPNFFCCLHPPLGHHDICKFESIFYCHLCHHHTTIKLFSTPSYSSQTTYNKLEHP